MRCSSNRHSTSIAEAGGTNTGSIWIVDGKRRQAGSIVGLRRLYTRTPSESGLVSHRLEQHLCQHTVTSEPSSSWTAYTSQQLAYQHELATSDLCGKRRKKAGTIWNAPMKNPGVQMRAPPARLSLQRIIQVASTRDANPRQPAWKAGIRRITTCLIQMAFTG